MLRHSFSEASMSVRIVSSKTDQYRQGGLSVGRTYKFSDLPSGRLSHPSSLLVFRGITRTKRGERLSGVGGLSYMRMRELLMQNGRSWDLM